MGLVTPRTVVDTLHGPWVPMRVTVTLDEPLVGDHGHGLHLDGPLAWCAYLEWIEACGHHPAPIRAARSPLDFDLGLATWTCAPTATPADPDALGADAQAWGHACSRHSPVPLARTAVPTRRKPPDLAHTRYTTDKRLHLAAGPGKARDVIHPASWVDDITWWALGDPARVRDLLSRLRHIGRLARHGYGRVAHIDVTPDDDRDAWRDRSMPDPAGPVQGIRAPYHHDTRRMPCSRP